MGLVIHQPAEGIKFPDLLLLLKVPPEERTQFSEGFETMRSLLIATAMCVAALTFTGCSFTVGGPCNSFTHKSRIKGECGCAKTAACDSCTETCADGCCGDSCSPGKLMGSWKGQPECGGVNFGQGAPCGMENVTANRPGLLSKLGSKRASSACGCVEGDCSCESAMQVAPSISNCGCGSGACDGGCGRSRTKPNLGMRLFERGSECSGDCGGACGGDCGAMSMVGTQGGLLGRGNGMRAPGSRIAGRMQSGSRGCGRFGCGRDGKLCLSCKARSGLGLGLELPPALAMY